MLGEYSSDRSYAYKTKAEAVSSIASVKSAKGAALGSLGDRYVTQSWEPKGRRRLPVLSLIHI